MSTNEPMTQERLDTIQARVEASTWTEAEPWEYAEDDWDGWCVSICDSGFGTAYVAKDIQQGEDEGRSDAALIANAPQDLADLLAEVERLRARPTVDKAMVERGARALAGLGPGEDWPRNHNLGNGPCGTRDDDYRDAMREGAKEVLDAALGTGEGS